MNKQLQVLTLIAAVGLSGAASAALVDRGGGLIYDTDRNITWLQDANYARTSGYDADGAMTWDQAMTWAANLSYFDSVRAVSYTDWRLPSALNSNSSGPCWGYWCINSEMGHLHYTELGNSVGNYASLKTGPFTNVVLLANYYWSGTQHAWVDPAWYFRFENGTQEYFTKTVNFYAWAVRPGDVVTTAVPEPETYAMMLAGLGLMGFMARRRKQKEAA